METCQHSDENVLVVHQEMVIELSTWARCSPFSSELPPQPLSTLGVLSLGTRREGFPLAYSRVGLFLQIHQNVQMQGESPSHAPFAGTLALPRNNLLQGFLIL